MNKYVLHAFVVSMATGLVMLAAQIAGNAMQEANNPRASYVLGPNDQVSIRAVDAEEISDKTYRIGSNGELSLPMIGRVKAAGLTVEQLESALAAALKPYIRQPKVAATVTEFQSQPVSLIGAVHSPSVLQLQGNKTLVEVLSMVGGVSSDAGNSVVITRKSEWGVLPLPGAKADPSGRFSTGQVVLKDILEARDPDQNITIRPNDIISVPRAEHVYVLGAVKRAGTFVLNDRDALSVLQAISLAEGLNTTAAQRDAKILRVNPGATRRAEMPVDLGKIFAGSAEDVALRPDDILFVPDSKEKRAALRTLEVLTSIGTTVGAGALLSLRP